jgi:hypothetical protein
MANAKKCDTCGSYYDAEEPNRAYNVHKMPDEKPLDLCPDCYEHLESFLTSMSKPKRAKKYKLSDAGHDKMSSAASARIKKAQKYRKENPDCTWGEALSASSNKNLKIMPKKKRLGRPPKHPKQSEGQCWKYAKGKSPADETAEPADEF